MGDTGGHVQLYQTGLEGDQRHTTVLRDTRRSLLLSGHFSHQWNVSHACGAESSRSDLTKWMATSVKPLWQQSEGRVSGGINIFGLRSKIYLSEFSGTTSAVSHQRLRNIRGPGECWKMAAGVLSLWEDRGGQQPAVGGASHNPKDKETWSQL